MKTSFPLAHFKQLNTPLYYYDMDLLNLNLKRAKEATSRYGFHLHYALKANANDRILKTIQSYDIGADCVSGNEIDKAFQAGFSPDTIAFAGVGKSDEEIVKGLELQIFSFNVESIPELEAIADLAKENDTTAAIALRINPNVDAKTHRYITTGIEENKFGIDFWDLKKVLGIIREREELILKGIHFHIGSQITDLNVFKGLCLRVNEIQEWFLEQHIIPEHINLGGGLGINYHSPEELPDFDTFFALISKHLKVQPRQTVHFELGRSLVAHCGSLISRVLYVKEGIKTKFTILDAGMTELIRPALYQAYHRIENLSSDKTMEYYDVVGPICESSDCFGKAVELNGASRGDLFAIRSTGAYGEVMKSNYNLRTDAQAYYSDTLKSL